MSYMDEALAQARLAMGRTSPNPAVGALIVKDGVIASRGHTQPPGGPHAEIVALQQAGEATRGATLYVTLEPCCYFGRTPPCTQAIITVGLAEVHIATLDPNPRVAGQGRAELEAAGIHTVVGEGEEEAKAINEAYCKYITTGLPLVIAKFSVSLDGKIATRTGDSRWVAGEASREYVHWLRDTTDAIMVGVGTVLIDDPQLTTRPSQVDPVRGVRHPLRIIADSTARTPPSAAVLKGPGRVLVATGPLPEERLAPLRDAGAEVMVLPLKGGHIDVSELLRELGRRQVTGVIVEGGGKLLGSFFDANLVDKVMVFVAPVIVGGRRAVPAVAGLGVAHMAQALRLQRVSIQRFGDDTLITGYLNSSLAGAAEGLGEAGKGGPRCH
ncbi:MAG: bifunctional diaminohydroxyphosphoribosylaminopyrimidine deaminase/5-amino-6-(5-phosphoribosylamino)uracil reductase RibD [Chloroflexi bacterium]|nr:bifunctional diaminohydroxyphosphoribosylaminopyrimidine deaminase/5-amino-6-(5-phosphoribosylamino)uracil reductase RibD [Chloroflexota bacterium]